MFDTYFDMLLFFMFQATVSKDGKPMTMQVKLVGNHLIGKNTPSIRQQLGTAFRAATSPASVQKMSSPSKAAVAVGDAGIGGAAVTQTSSSAAVTVINESAALQRDPNTAARLSSICVEEEDNNDSSLLCLDDQVLL